MEANHYVHPQYMGQQIRPLEKNTKSTFIIVFDFCIEFLMGQKFLFINNQPIS